MPTEHESSPTPNPSLDLEPILEFVECELCGNEQADMGHNVACEGCGHLMPTNDPGFAH